MNWNGVETERLLEVGYCLYAFDITILPKTKIKDRKPIPKTNVAAIIPINKILIFTPPY